MNDVNGLTQLNLRFVDAFRKGSWDMLRPILAPEFSYLDGGTGEVWTMGRYINDLESNPVPDIEIDQLRIHTAGDVAVVSSRSSQRPGLFNRYVDTYQRRDGSWLCVHACVWPLQAS